MAKFFGLRGSSLGTVISGVCGLCFLCFGYAQGVLGGLLTVPAFLARFPQLDMINDPSNYKARILGITMGTWNIGCFTSAILTIFIGDWLGRRRTLMLGLVLWAIGETIQCSSYSYGQFVAGRFIAGFGNGFTTSTVPAYQAECVKSHRKGTILMISAGAFIAAGLALSYWLTFAFSYVGDVNAAWRVPIAFQIVFAVIAFIVLQFLPESPRWLILTGRENEALQVLSAINDEDIDGPEIRDEFLQIKDAILVMSQGSTSSLRSNTEKRNMHRAALAYFVQVFQQMSGINLALQYLSIMFFTQFGYSDWLARLLGACCSTEYFLASFITVVGIDRFWGRRSLMMFGAAGMSGCMVLLAVLLYLWQVHGISAGRIAGTVFLFGFCTFFAIGWQGMAWLYQVEIVPLRIRGPANALSTSGNWLFNFVVVLIAPIAFYNITYNTYIIFACTNFIIVPLVYFFYPETAYRSLEEVDVLFHLANEAPGNPWLNVVKISQQEPLWFGRKGDHEFDYEKSEWHQHCNRFSSSGTTLENSPEKHGFGGSTPESDQGGAGILPGTAISSPEDTSPTNSAISEKNLMPPGYSSKSSYQPSPHSPFNQNQKSKGKKKRFSNPLAPTIPQPAMSQTQSRPSAQTERNESYQSNRSGKSAHSAHSDPNWAESEMAPEPLRVSRTPSVTTTGTNPRASKDSWHSTAHPPLPGAVPPPVLTSHYHPPEDSEHTGPGFYRTSSGRETYFPSGHPDYVEQVDANRTDELRGQEITLPRRSAERERRSSSRRERDTVERPSWGSTESFRRFAPREAGRGA
ncbi:hypothetical protein K491DRAFT_461987 [Lophiostoma macrostomum CBS 122681]|uniref:Major facilitator superfamily (MFS) profile domain-containing protein n=1 Tax=Lophiostoma macrostomum CBS 122681 TaxID=1314788 RepID=A0A6A6T4I0_9PLEO|nr:hypothetical protein K491DRAFT_461987 [Lophiostoma macrostomum CBS 122681]